MSAYYVLKINDVSDPHNHLYSVVHPDNWDQGEGLVAAHAADYGYSIEVFFSAVDVKTWTMTNNGSPVATALLRREYQ